MRITITDDFDGQRIDRFLTAIERIGTRVRARGLLEAGLVSIDGRSATTGNKVRAGYVIELPHTELAEPDPRTRNWVPIDVLHEDDDVLVVDKPAGLLVHTAPGHHELTLVELLGGRGVDLAEAGDPLRYRPGVVHRLDRDTSGVIVFAKHHLAQRRLQLALRERTVEREYIALVRGHVTGDGGRVEMPIGRDVTDPKRRSTETDAPQDAVTHFAVQERLPTTTLLALRLETGRTHQIRVHMQTIGHPVVADATYGTSPELGLARQFLHAARLTFPHPRTGEPVDVACPLAEDLAAALAAARHAVLAASARPARAPVAGGSISPG